MTSKHHKETFDKISEKKREKVLQAATSEFAKNGYKTANINVIARNAGISIGSMYNYFSSKENLFLTVINEGYKHLEAALSRADLEQGDIFDKLEEILRVAQRFSKENPEITQVYCDITSEGLSHLSRKLSRNIETITALFYRKQLEEAKAKGIVDPALDDWVTSFCIDNIILLMQFSYTSEYYKERLKIFVGEDAFDEDERLISGMMRFIRGALAPKNR